MSTLRIKAHSTPAVREFTDTAMIVVPTLDQHNADGKRKGMPRKRGGMRENLTTGTPLHGLRGAAEELGAILRRRWPFYVLLPVVVGGSLSVAVFGGLAARENAAKSTPAPVEHMTLTSGSDASTPGDDSGGAAGGTPADHAAGNAAASSGQTNVTVNGQNMTVPANGSTHTEQNTANGHTSVDITHNSSGTSSSSLHVSVQSTSTETEGQ